MKKENIKTKHFFLTLMILAGFLTSCDKEEMEHYAEQEGKVEVRPQLGDDRGGGDDEEDPIIIGLVQDTNGDKVAGAQVQIFEVGANAPTDTKVTNSAGTFQMTVSAGDYFFKVTVGGTITTTNSFSIFQNSNIVITI